jgi:hypothetical protein
MEAQPRQGEQRKSGVSLGPQQDNRLRFVNHPPVVLIAGNLIGRVQPS